jgi:hypothetical protein
LIVGATTRYLLDWDIGPQVYLSFVMTFGIFVTSPLTASLFQTRKLLLAVLAAAVACGMGALFMATAGPAVSEWQRTLSLVAAGAIGASLYGFARLFTLESEEKKKILADFFRKLETPVDVAREVYGAGRKQVSTLPIVGRTIIFMGLLVGVAFVTPLETTERLAVVAMMVILFGFGGLLWIAGRRSEGRGEAERAVA